MGRYIIPDSLNLNYLQGLVGYSSKPERGKAYRRYIAALLEVPPLNG
jgi:hypothetical protein